MKLYLSLLVSVFMVCNLLVAQNAPVTSVASLYGCSAGVVTLPVKVNGFSNIGAFSLDLQYDPANLSFVQGIRNPALYGSFMAGDNILPGGMHHIVISWFGASTTLPDGSILLDLKFNFTGGTSNLYWLDDGSSCEYANASYSPLADTPTGCYYNNGDISVNKLLTVGVLLEGLYNPQTHTMRSALDQFTDPCDVPVADYVTIELHNATNYPQLEYTAVDFDLGINGLMKVPVPAGKNGMYYITVKHRNGIQLVSANPVSFASTTTDYSFLNAASRAYGNNMIQASDGNWMMYTGDTNQDDIVDSGDMIMVDNDVSSFATGYISTDCNGDGLVDSTDMILVDNNAAAFVTAALP
jgi:hypothetical protein